MRPQQYQPLKPMDAQSYLDAALSAGSRRAAKRTHRGADREAHMRAMEQYRFLTIRDTLTASLQKLHDSYPSFDQMSEFLLQLFEQDLEVRRVKQALGGIHGLLSVLGALTKESIARMRDARSIDQILRVRAAYIGRVSSITRQAQKHLLLLDAARGVLRNLPSIDDELFTVAIAGFPNVGKSTLLSLLTTAKPEIKPYAFTTKGLNVGYFDYRYNPIQCVDTPGTLNRKAPSAVERKAEIAIKYLAHIIVYIFDPTEGGYTLAQQDELYRRTLGVGKPVLIYVSKTDIVDAEVVRMLSETYPEVHTSSETLKKAIGKAFRAEFL
jgi:nucleolar GTP-binding protein